MDMVQWLVDECGCAVDDETLFAAARGGYGDIVHWLTHDSLVDAIAAHRDEALRQAVGYDDMTPVRVLVEAGNIQCQCGG